MASDAVIPNIYVIGPQSTGKTTLVNKLRHELQRWLADARLEAPQIVSEVARTVLTKHKYTANDITSSTDRCFALQKLILEAQAFAEKEALLRSSWFISDRSGFYPLVYAREYVSPQAVVEMQQLPAWIKVKTRMENSLIVLCEAGTPWLMDDGVRLMPDSEDAWMKLSRDFCKLLDETGFGYCVVPRTMLGLSERAEFVLAKWEERRLSLNQSQSI